MGRALGGSKYNNRKIDCDGYTFDSVAEFERYTDLKLLVASGAIESLSVHPQFVLVDKFRDSDGKAVRAITYKADFMYLDIESGDWVVEDVKGGRATRTEAFGIRSRLFKWKHPEYKFRIIES